MFFVFLVGFVNGIEGFCHDSTDDFVVVHLFESFGLLQNIEGSLIEVIFEGDLLIDEELRVRRGLR